MEYPITMTIRDWSNLIPEALELIFKDLSLEEKLTVVPSVCKSWSRMVSSLNCWQEIDLRKWSKSCTSQQLDRLVRLLVLRSRGSLTLFATWGISTDALFSFVADNANSLQILAIPGSKISDSIVEQVANRLANIVALDLSYCVSIGARAIEAFGKNCECLSILYGAINFGDGIRDNEAFAIAATMPNLVHLEIAYLTFTGKVVSEVLSKCKKLEFVQIRGHYKIKLKHEQLKKDKFDVFEFIYN